MYNSYDTRKIASEDAFYFQALKDQRDCKMQAHNSIPILFGARIVRGATSNLNYFYRLSVTLT